MNKKVDKVDSGLYSLPSDGSQESIEAKYETVFRLNEMINDTLKKWGTVLEKLPDENKNEKA